jgi:hypothetical protein
MAKNKGNGKKTHNPSPQPSKKMKNNAKEDILASESDHEPELDDEEEVSDLVEEQSQSDDASSDDEPTDDFLGGSDEEGNRFGDLLADRNYKSCNCEILFCCSKSHSFPGLSQFTLSQTCVVNVQVSLYLQSIPTILCSLRSKQNHEKF